MHPLIRSGRYYFLTDWIAYLIVHKSFITPALLIILDEAGVPLPVPGDFTTIYMGYQVSKGELSYAVAFLFPILMSIIGSSILYFLSRRYGERLIRRFGKHLNLDEKRLKHLEKQFDKWGIWAIVFGRHIPGVRIPITIFAGLSGISYIKFVLSTVFSTAVGVAFYLWIGQRLGPKTIRLLHGHPRYYLVTFIPITITLLFLLFLRYHRNRGQEK